MDVNLESDLIMTASEGSSRCGIAPRRQFGGRVVGMSFRQCTRTWSLPASMSASRPFVHRLLPMSDPPVCFERSAKGESLSASPATLRVAMSMARDGPTLSPSLAAMFRA